MANKDSYAVIGLGRFGATLALSLAGEGAEVIAADKNEELVDEVAGKVTQAVTLDATNEKVLKRIGMHEVDVAIVTVGEDFEASILTTMLLKSLGVKRIITRVVSPVQQRVIEMLGVEVIAPERDSALLLALKLLKPGLIDNIPVAEGLSLIQLKAPDRWLERTIRDLDLRRRFNCNIVAIKSSVEGHGPPSELASGVLESGGKSAEETSKKVVVRVPRPEDVVRPDDVLLILGRNEDLDQLSGES